MIILGLLSLAGLMALIITVIYLCTHDYTKDEKGDRYSGKDRRSSIKVKGIK